MHRTRFEVVTVTMWMGLGFVLRSRNQKVVPVEVFGPEVVIVMEEVVIVTVAVIAMAVGLEVEVGGLEAEGVVVEVEVSN